MKCGEGNQGSPEGNKWKPGEKRFSMCISYRRRLHSSLHLAFHHCSCGMRCIVAMALLLVGLLHVYRFRYRVQGRMPYQFFEGCRRAPNDLS